MQVADVWLNGRHVTTHYGGYLPFTIDASDGVAFGRDNVVALRLDNRDQPLVPPGKPESDLDFDYFGGLYRDVTFVATDPVHVTDPILADRPAGGGVFVTFPAVAADRATVQVKTDLGNETAEQRDVEVRQELVDGDGRVVGSTAVTGPVAARAAQAFTQRFDVDHPRLWHPEHPTLYALHTRVYDGGRLTDEVVTPHRHPRVRVPAGRAVHQRRAVLLHRVQPPPGLPVPWRGRAGRAAAAGRGEDAGGRHDVVPVALPPRPGVHGRLRRAGRADDRFDAGLAVLHQGPDVLGPVVPGDAGDDPPEPEPAVGDPVGDRAERVELQRGLRARPPRRRPTPSSPAARATRAATPGCGSSGPTRSSTSPTTGRSCPRSGRCGAGSSATTRT